MWQVETNNEGFLRLLGSSDERREVTRPLESMPSRPPTRGMYLIWGNELDDAIRVPNVIITKSGEARTFVAWTSTYLDGFRPLTSLCRVMDWDVFQRCNKSHIPREAGALTVVCAALTFAEALTLGRGRVSPASLNIPTCETTYSFCRSRAFVYGFQGNSEWLIQRWYVAREIARQPRRAPTPEAIEPLWQVLCALRGDVESRMQGSLLAVVEACAVLSRTGSIPIDHLHRLVPAALDVDRIFSTMSETREERVTTFESLAHALYEPTHSQEPSLAFFLGYVASRLSPGTLEYTSLVISQLDKHPLILMWYALCEAIHPNTKVLNLFGGFCRRLLRDIVQPESLLDRPQCDIALEELDVLSSARGGFDYIRSASSGARVDIHPFITPTIRISTAGQETQAALFSSREDGGGQEVVRHLQRAREEIDAAYQRLRGSKQEPVDEPPPRKKRRGRD